MNKVYRDGVDVGVAFASGAKRTMHKAPQASDVETYPSHVEHPPTAENAKAPEQGGASAVGRTKAFLRPVARHVYRLLRPAMRPVAFRFRRYLTEGMLQEVQASRESLQELQRVSAGMLQEVEASRESLQELQRVSASVLQEVQASRESLQELQRVSASMLQEVQAHVSKLFPRLDRIEQYSGATARRIAINCGQGEILVRTEVGYVLCSASDHAVLTILIETGELERGTRLLIQRFLSPGDVFVDVGANLGLHTLAAARAMQGCGKIIAFEPFEPTKHLLEKSVWMNGFSEITEIHQAAVSNTIGHQKLFLGATSGHHSLFPVDTPSGLLLNPVEVSLVRLDGVIQDDQKVNLIKIDAEGAELEVLESAASVIKHNLDIALIVEFGPSHLKRTGHSTEQWLSAFTDLGLIYRAINADTGMLEDWPLEQLENTDTINLFFTRPESKAWTKLKKTA